MIPLVTREEARAMDADAVVRLGIPSLTLMEDAGAGAAREILARFAGRLQHATVVCGTGQNGGDGWVVARHLILAGRTPECVLVGDRAKVRGDAKTNLDALLAMNGRLKVAGSEADVQSTIEPATLVVDALFGTGLDRPLDGLAAIAVDCINADPRRTSRPVVALDLPSGIDANTGAVLGHAVRAALTTTFGAHKRGLWQYPGRAHAGEILLVPIGVEAPREPDAMLLEPSDLRALLPARAPDAHKGDAGRVVIFAGAPGTTGAALLAAHGSLRAGAALVIVAPRPEARAAVDAKSLETMTAALPAGDGDDVVAAAVALVARAHVAVVGPGFGHHDLLAAKLAMALPLVAVLDADALTALGDRPELLRAARGPRVLTPHPGEAAALLGRSVASVQRDRFAAAAELAQRSGHVVVLKGAGTIVATPDGRCTACAAGTPALATGGTGDVLAGVIAAMLVGLDAATSSAVISKAASTGVLLHALAGELAAHGADRGILAHEVADALPRVMASR